MWFYKLRLWTYLNDFLMILRAGSPAHSTSRLRNGNPLDTRVVGLCPTPLRIAQTLTNRASRLRLFGYVDVRALDRFRLEGDIFNDACVYKNFFLNTSPVFSGCGEEFPTKRPRQARSRTPYHCDVRSARVQGFPATRDSKGLPLRNPWSLVRPMPHGVFFKRNYIKICFYKECWSWE